MKNKCIAEVKINNQTHSIRATVHSQKRMRQRNIDEYVIVGNILALGKERLESLKNSNEDAIIIDKDTNTSVVIAVENNTITIITVIGKSNVFVKTNTKIVNL